jgi:hypothetical protein
MATGDTTHGPYRDHIGIDGLRNQRKRFKERARVEYLAGVEEEWRRRYGRSMTARELEGALRRYPGDV